MSLFVGLSISHILKTCPILPVCPTHTGNVLFPWLMYESAYLSILCLPSPLKKISHLNICLASNNIICFEVHLYHSFSCFFLVLILPLVKVKTNSKVQLVLGKVVCLALSLIFPPSQEMAILGINSINYLLPGGRVKPSKR